jgi:hypothetical protein
MLAAPTLPLSLEIPSTNNDIRALGFILSGAPYYDSSGVAFRNLDLPRRRVLRMKPLYS